MKTPIWLYCENPKSDWNLMTGRHIHTQIADAGRVPRTKIIHEIFGQFGA